MMELLHIDPMLILKVIFSVVSAFGFIAMVLFGAVLYVLATWGR